MLVQPHKAIVGANAFAHESGIHQVSYHLSDSKRINRYASVFTCVINKAMYGENGSIKIRPIYWENVLLGQKLSVTLGLLTSRFVRITTLHIQHLLMSAQVFMQ